MIKRNNAYIILALAFVILIGTGFCKGVLNEKVKLTEKINGEGIGIRDVLDKEALEKAFAYGPFDKSTLINISGYGAKATHMKSYFSGDGIYISDNGYIVHLYPKTSTDYEFEQIVSFKKFCDKNNIKLLYVNEPTKYLNDEPVSEEFGVETFSNRNADKLMKRLREAGVAVVDLRDDLIAEGIDSYDIFYRTDHHWTTRGTLWAMPKIMKGLNEYCGYDIDLSIYDEEKYDMQDINNCWLGEQGRKVGASYVGLDDFTIIAPAFPTSYVFKSKDGSTEGTFEGFINRKRFNPENDIYESGSWHYGYKTRHAVNNDVDKGKVLVLGDSFGKTAEPFMSLAFHETNILVRRTKDEDFDVRKYVLEHGYDTVIIQYGQLMIGAHDQPDSANFLMYKLD